MKPAPLPEFRTEIEIAELARLTALALDLATEAHRGQKRNHSRLPYITHPIAVAESVRPELKPIALLHDVLEATHLSEDYLRLRFPAWIVDRVALLSRSGQPYDRYLLLLGTDPPARAVKKADLDHNLSDLKPGTQRDKYLLAKALLNLMHLLPEPHERVPHP